MQDSACQYYSSHGAASQDEYVEQTFYGDQAQIDRTHHTIDLIPEGVETLLDVGAGFGVFLHELQQRRPLEAEGIELSESRIQWGLERGLVLRAGSAHELPYEDQNFDIVTCCETLEHLPYGVYEAALEELPRVARHWILMSVPYDERRNFARCPYCGTMANPHYHFRSFAPTDLEGLFPGFALHSVGTIGEVSVLTMLKPYLPAPWHSQMICPACNYRAESVAAQQRTRKLGKVKAAVRALPFPRRPRWLTGLFRREF